MNEIERFKKNRMIPKGQYGLKPHEILGAKINGEKVVYINIPGKGYLAIDGKGNAYTTANESSVGSFDPGRSSFKPVRLTNYDRQQIYNAVTNGKVSSMFSSTGSTVTGITDYWKAQGAPTVIPTASTQTVVTSPDTNKGSQRQAYSAQQQQRQNASRTIGRSKVTPKGQQYWDNEFVNFMEGLTSDQQAWLKTNGLDNATTLQTYLDSNYGGVGKFGIDGKFGNDSKAAWNRFVASGNMGKNRDQEILAQKQVEPVLDASDPFGYHSTGNYDIENSQDLKTNGIRDWSSLVNYAGRNKNSDFTKLLSGYFGTNDITQWDRNKLESDAKIHGNYHGQDRSQLQGFLGGLQAKNNQQYYDKVATYAKQNPTSITPRFDFSKIIKLKVPEFKFNLSSAGASTLGNNMGLI